ARSSRLYGCTMGLQYCPCPELLLALLPFSSPFLRPARIRRPPPLQISPRKRSYSSISTNQSVLRTTAAACVKPPRLFASKARREFRRLDSWCSDTPRRTKTSPLIMFESASMTDKLLTRRHPLHRTSLPKFSARRRCTAIIASGTSPSLEFIPASRSSTTPLLA